MNVYRNSLNGVIERITDPDEAIKKQAIEEIVNFRGEKRIISYLINALKDKKKGIQQAATDALISIRGREVVEGIIPLLRDADITLRNIGFEILLKIGGDGIDILLSCLKDDDEGVRKYIVDLFGSVGDRRVVSALLLLLDDPCANVRASAVTSLGIIKEDVPISAIIHRLNDKEEWVRFAAVDALSHLGSKEAVPHLLKILAIGDNLMMCAVVEALGRLPDPASIKPILALIKKSPKNLRNTIIKTLINLSEHIELNLLDQLDKNEFIRYLVSIIEDDEDSIKFYALKGLTLLGDKTTAKPVLNFMKTIDIEDKEIVGLVKEALIKSKNIDAILTSLEAIDNKYFFIIACVLGELNAKDAVPVLMKKFEETDVIGKLEIIKALKNIADPKSKETLLKGMDHIDGHIRREAASALYFICDDNEVLQRLLDLIRNDVYMDVREASLDTIVGFGSKRVFDRLIELYSNPDPTIRRLAVKGIGCLKNPDGIKFLTTAQKDADSIVRREAVSAIHLTAGDSAIDYLTISLRDTDSQVRISAIYALSTIKDKKIIDIILSMLNDEDRWVKFQAIEALGRIGDPRSVDVMARFTDIDDVLLKIAVAKAVMNISGKKSIAILKKLAQDANLEVKNTALIALSGNI